MMASARYGGASVALIGLLTLGLWPFLDPPARAGVLTAAAIAIPIQVIAFAFLARYRDCLEGFMAAWVGGMALRATVVLVVALLFLRAGAETAVPMLLALAGFFFALLLLEPVYFRRDPEKEG